QSARTKDSDGRCRRKIANPKDGALLSSHNPLTNIQKMNNKRGLACQAANLNFDARIDGIHMLRGVDILYQIVIDAQIIKSCVNGEFQHAVQIALPFCQLVSKAADTE